MQLLLEKHEKSSAFKTGTVSNRRPQFRMSTLKGPLSEDYYDEMHVGKRLEIHRAVEKLADLGVIEAKWQKFRDGEELEKVYLDLDNVEEAYRLSEMEPKDRKLNRMLGVLSPLEDHPWEWVRNFWAYTRGELTEKRTGGLDLNEPDAYEDVVHTLTNLPEVKNGVMKRVMSHALFGDSKHFERHVQMRLLQIYKRYGTEEFEGDTDYLDSLGIIENPQAVLMAGPLTLSIAGKSVEINKLPGGVGISYESVRAIQEMKLFASSVLLIENLTVYHEYLQKRVTEKAQAKLPEVENTLVIYTAGFPHHGLRKFLGKLAGEAKGVPIVHWGDIDYGGILIFEHLKRNYFPSLQPVLMDAETLRYYFESGIKYEGPYRNKLISLTEKEKYSEWWPVVEELLESEVWLEQEAMLEDKSWNIRKSIKSIREV